MSRNKETLGNCHLCGNYGQLTFEHIPPQSAFNDRPVFYARLENAINAGQLDLKTGVIQQKGSGAHTLCGKCNNNTGNWYGRDFAEWCHQGMDYYVRSEGKAQLAYPYKLYPLRILKQIITIFFSVNGLEFSNANPDLVKFVLDKNEKHLPSYAQVYIYMMNGELMRQTGIVVRGGVGPLSIFSEFSFPPYGYVLSLDSPSPDKKLYDITYFKSFSYNDYQELFLKLPVLPTHLYIPGDYRTKHEIQKDYIKNISYRLAQAKKGKNKSRSCER